MIPPAALLLAVVATSTLSNLPADAQLPPAHGGRDCISPYNYQRKDGDFTQYHDNGNLCIPCPPRSISDPDHPFVCRPCPPNTYVYQNDCRACFPGTFVSEAGLCQWCDPYSYAENENSPMCKKCPPNTSTGRYGGRLLTECKGCKNGQYLRVEDLFFPHQATARCNECPLGTFNNKGAVTECEKCPEGTESSKDHKSCVPCRPGKIPSTDPSYCQPCPGNSYTSRTGETKCKMCPPGTVAEDRNARCVVPYNLANPGCKGCEAGKQPVRNAAGKMVGCEKCPTGTVNTRCSMTECTACPHGLTANTAQDECLCPGKSVVELDLSSECALCPTSSKKIDNQSCKCGENEIYQAPLYPRCGCRALHRRVDGKCLPCTEEQIVETETKYGRCALCREGDFLNKQTGLCEQCPPGTESPNQNRVTTCTPCEFTHFDNAGVKRCGCGPGTKEKKGKGKCVPCGVGTAGMHGHCEICSGDKYSDVRGLANCKICPEGRRYKKYGKPQRKCPPLLKCPTNAMELNGVCTCTNNFVPVKGRSKLKCIPCPPNSSRLSQHGSDECTCNLGYVRKSNGKCKPCPPGSSPSSRTQCRPCKKNYILVNSANGSCRECPRSSYSLAKGGTKCKKCSTGTFVTKLGDCATCLPGHRVLNGDCVICENSVSQGGSSSYCGKCPTGMVPNVDNSSCI